jgi:hypothetical protein
LKLTLHQRYQYCRKLQSIGPDSRGVPYARPVGGRGGGWGGRAGRNMIGQQPGHTLLTPTRGEPQVDSHTLIDGRDLQHRHRGKPPRLWPVTSTCPFWKHLCRILNAVRPPAEPARPLMYATWEPEWTSWERLKPGISTERGNGERQGYIGDAGHRVEDQRQALAAPEET